MRVYVGTTVDGLRALHATSSLGPAPLSACAVTPALRESYAEADAEELEYAALTDAAAQSLRLVASSGGEPRRVVVVAEAPDEAITPTGESRSSVTVTADVPLRKVASIHIDDPQVDLDDAEGWELMWFATQELPYLLG